MDHGGMDMGGHCQMSMTFNWNIEDVCIVHTWWRITNRFEWLLSLLVVVALGVFYEWSRKRATLRDERLFRRLAQTRDLGEGGLGGGGPTLSSRATRLTPSMAGPRSRSPTSEDGLIGDAGGLHHSNGAGSGAGTYALLKVPREMQVIRAAHYAFNVYLAFYLMLIAMTFNGYFLLAIALGAGLGYFVFERDIEPFPNALSSKGMACH